MGLGHPSSAACLLANSDYFFLLTLLGTFIPDRAFSLGSGFKKTHTANILVSLFLNHCCAAPGSHGPVPSGRQSASLGLPVLGVLEPPVWVSSAPEGNTQRLRPSEKCPAQGGRWTQELRIWLRCFISQVTSLKCCLKI